MIPGEAKQRTVPLPCCARPRGSGKRLLPISNGKSGGCQLRPEQTLTSSGARSQQLAATSFLRPPALPFPRQGLHAAPSLPFPPHPLVRLAMSMPRLCPRWVARSSLPMAPRGEARVRQGAVIRPTSCHAWGRLFGVGISASEQQGLAKRAGKLIIAS